MTSNVLNGLLGVLAHFPEDVFLKDKNACFSCSFSEHSHGGNGHMGTAHGDSSQGELLLQ